MNRLIVCVIGVALLAGSVDLMIANAQQAQPPAFIAGDRPVTAEQVLAEIANRRMVKRRHLAQRQIYRSDRLHDGETSKMAVDSQTGRLRADNDDDDDDDDD